METNFLTASHDQTLAEIKNLEENFDAAVASFRKLLDFEISYISRFDSGKQIIEAVDYSVTGKDIPIKKGTAGDLEKTYCKRAADKKLPKFIRNAQEEPLLADIPGIAALGIGTLISVPITMHDGTPYGSICGFSRSVRNDVSERDVKFVELLAEFASRVLENNISKSAALRSQHNFITDIIANRSFHSVYQAIIDINTNDCIGLEALTRFDDQSISSPATIFRGAKHSGQQSDLEIAVLDEPINRTHCMRGECYVAINVSPETITSNAFKNLIAKADPNHLVIELNEADTVQSYFALNNHLSEMRKHGVRLAVDDVGSGYANFRHILELSPEILKIDISLIRGIHECLKKQALTSAIVAYATEFGCNVIAEGVESEEELNTLKKIGINLVQGYIFSKPSVWKKEK